MSNLSLDFSDNTFQSLVARIRPGNLAQYIGQQRLLAAGRPLPHAIEARHLHSIILWGPPGTGRTTLAEVIARYTNTDVERTPAVMSGVKEIREATGRVRQNRNASRRTILFVDGTHRFNKGQQDAFLPHIEDDTIMFIGVTIENPSSKLNSVLLLRTRVYLLKLLTTDDIEQVLNQVISDRVRGYGGQDTVLPSETRQATTEPVDDDVQRALNILEMMADIARVDGSGKRVLKPELLTEIAGERSARFGNKGDRFYNLISALHKSVHGSTPDAAPYWYACITSAGSDSLYVARRYLTTTSEDVGNVNPHAIQVVIPAWGYFTHMGPVGGGRVIARAIVYLTYALKNSAVYTASKATLTDTHERPDYDVSVRLHSVPTRLIEKIGYGQEYRYAHDEPNVYAAGGEYFPQGMAQARYYHPTNRGPEDEIGEKSAWLVGQDQSSPVKRYRQRYRCDNVVSVSP